ncbi:MAG TPA: efflux RND transporter permease subunit [Planctomycetes bacterium]|nr:efflux RND transporter permease subunit [Planctomycetota bacterium]
MDQDPKGLLAGLIRFSLKNRLVVLLGVAFLVFLGMLNAPFDWDMGGIERDPVPADAIPDIGENQQIVFTRWDGRSPQDIDDQITYPLTQALMGVPGVKTIRSNSMFGFSSIYVIFEEKIDFYWSRSRILEKLASLPAGLLPAGVKPELGPDATALGQIFWYTLEGRDEQGNPAPAFNLAELRSIQDFQVRYALLAVKGVSEVASIGGFVREYQVDVDPDALQAYKIPLDAVLKAVQGSNLDVGARTIEVNRVEYVIRGIGFLRSLKDLEETVVRAKDGTGIRLKDVARVTFGPALRRGVLDRDGAEAVGGVVVSRYGANPLAVIKGVRQKLKEIEAGLPQRVMDDGRRVQVKVVPFYDRTGLIQETLGTLNEALYQEILITIIVVLIMVLHLRAGFLISVLLPLAVLSTFVLMRLFGVDANVVALSGIAIAIGTLVDMGIVITENVLVQLGKAPPGEPKWKTIWKASHEVSGAVLTSTATTVVSFFPVFALEAQEGKMFRPLAFTKTFALMAAAVIAVTVLPVLATYFFGKPKKDGGAEGDPSYGAPKPRGRAAWKARLWVLLKTFWKIPALLAAFVAAILLADSWEPMGAGAGLWKNRLMTLSLLAVVLLFFQIFQWLYSWFLRGMLWVRPLFFLFIAFFVWQGYSSWKSLGREFLPKFDEGSFLFMPTTMPHAGVEETVDVLSKLDQLIRSVPEVTKVVGKAGRVESALDPAPLSMVETIVHYKTEYIEDGEGHKLLFKYDEDKEEFVRDAKGELIPDDEGRPFRSWRKKIKSRRDIWNEIAKAAQLTGTTSAPLLQPIETRLVMLQTGMRAPIGIKVYGKDLKTLEKVGLQIEAYLKEVKEIDPGSVVADRIVGKPYIEIHLDRFALSRYGIRILDAQRVLETALGGKPLTWTVEGRERYPVRVRYPRDYRSAPDKLGEILLPTQDGKQIPLAQVAKTEFVRGPQSIKSEDNFLVGYVVFNRAAGVPEINAVLAAKAYLQKKIDNKDWILPSGTIYKFTGNYENQLRMEKRMKLLVPMALLLIFVLLFFQFKSSLLTLMVFSGVLVAWAGGFMLLAAYGDPSFLDFSLFGENMRELFRIHPVQMSVAVWVGFLALFGIATDDGVVMMTFLRQKVEERKPKNAKEVRAAVLEAGKRRIRPCLMTTATTVLALLPVLSSRGKGADLMIPMAIPSFGGMAIELLTLFVVPTLFCSYHIWRLRLGRWKAKLVKSLTFHQQPQTKV